MCTITLTDEQMNMRTITLTDEQKKEIVRAYWREYRRTNPEVIRGIEKRRRERHREKLNEYQRDYRRNHPEKVREWYENRKKRAEGEEGQAHEA